MILIHSLNCRQRKTFRPPLAKCHDRNYKSTNFTPYIRIYALSTLFSSPISQVLHNWIPSSSTNDPNDLLISLIYLSTITIINISRATVKRKGETQLMFRPCRNQAEITSVQNLSLLAILAYNRSRTFHSIDYRVFFSVSMYI